MKKLEKWDLSNMVHEQVTLQSLSTYMFISIFLIILGIFAPIIGEIIYLDGLSNVAKGTDINDDDLKEKGADEVIIGLIVKDMAIGFILTGIAITLLGLLRAKIPSGEQICPNCYKTNPKSYKYCHNCGHDLKRGTIKKCPKCLKPIKIYQKFCSYCGSEMEWTKDEEE